IVSKLRRLAARPGSAGESELLEMAFAVLVGAERGREAVGRWVNDPVGCAQEASERIQSVMRRLEPLRQALRPPSAEAKPSTEIVPPAPAAPPPSVVEAKPPPPPPVEPPKTAMPAEILVAAPGVPTGLTATAEKSRIALSWTSAAGATRYSVKRSEAVGTPFRVIATVTDCSYADEKATPGTTCFYMVSGSNEAGEGGDSAPAQATIAAPPAAPSNLTATVWLGQVSLKWTQTPGATTYRVKRSSAPGGPFTILANLDGSSFLDESVQPATTYHYVVAGAGAAGDGPDSAAVAAV